MVPTKNAGHTRKLESYRWPLPGLEVSDAVMPSRAGYRPSRRWTKSLWLLLQSEMAHTFWGRDRSAHHDVCPSRELLAMHPKERISRQVTPVLLFAQLLARTFR